MSLLNTGFYTLRNMKTNKCLENGKGNDVDVITCDKANPRTIWGFDKGKGTVCNRQTRNCLHASDNHTVSAYPDDGSDRKRWNYNDKTLTLCNQSDNGYCLEQGGASSQALRVAAYNDDKDFNKKWDIDPAQCVTTIGPFAPLHIGTVLTNVNHDDECPNVCKSKGAEYANQWRGGLKTSGCWCNKWDACKQ